MKEVFQLKRVYMWCALRGDKESWIRSKYVEKKFIHKLPETGRSTLLRRSSARRRTNTQERSMQQRPPLKPKPNRATLPRLTGRRDGETQSVCLLAVCPWVKGEKKKERVTDSVDLSVCQGWVPATSKRTTLAPREVNTTFWAVYISVIFVNLYLGCLEFIILMILIEINSSNFPIHPQTTTFCATQSLVQLLGVRIASLSTEAKRNRGTC